MMDRRPHHVLYPTSEPYGRHERRHERSDRRRHERSDCHRHERSTRPTHAR
jgi:hypothetical protein